MSETAGHAAAEEPRQLGEARSADGVHAILQAQRLELIGTLAAGLVHNFNNVLTVIGSAADMLLESLPESDPLRLDVQNIQRATRHGASLTKQLLALSKRQAIERTHVELNAVVQEVAQMSRLFLGPVNLILQLEPNGAPALVDRGEMEQVLLNLLLNSRDALPNGGSIVVTTARLTYTSATAPRHCSLRGPVVRLRVQDDGVGIDAETQRRIFEPFFTTKPADRGTGLGLPTVEAIVKASGGCVELASRPRVGTTVDVVLPDAERASLQAA